MQKITVFSFWGDATSPGTVHFIFSKLFVFISGNNCIFALLKIIKANYHGKENERSTASGHFGVY